MPAGGGLIESVFQSVFITNPQNRRGVMKEFSRLEPFSSVQTMDQLGEENTHTHTGSADSPQLQHEGERLCVW